MPPRVTKTKNSIDFVESSISRRESHLFNNNLLRLHVVAVDEA